MHPLRRGVVAELAGIQAGLQQQAVERIGTTGHDRDLRNVGLTIGSRDWVPAVGMIFRQSKHAIRGVGGRAVVRYVVVRALGQVREHDFASPLAHLDDDGDFGACRHVIQYELARRVGLSRAQGT